MCRRSESICPARPLIWFRRRVRVLLVCGEDDAGSIVDRRWQRESGIEDPVIRSRLGHRFGEACITDRVTFLARNVRSDAPPDHRLGLFLLLPSVSVRRSDLKRINYALRYRHVVASTCPRTSRRLTQKLRRLPKVDFVRPTAGNVVHRKP